MHRLFDTPLQLSPSPEIRSLDHSPVKKALKLSFCTGLMSEHNVIQSWRNPG
jgi:hypothetical protein